MPKHQKASDDVSSMQQSFNWLATKIRQLEGKVSVIDATSFHTHEERLSLLERVYCFIDVDSLSNAADAVYLPLLR